MFKIVKTVGGAIRRHRNDRGAALVEAALAIPILLLVIMGSVEFGFGWEAKSATASGVRTGVLRAASIGDQPETDIRIMQSLVGEIGTDNADQIEWVMIFNATGVADKQAQIDACALNVAGGGTFDQCVVYPTSVLQAVVTSADPAAYQAANFDNGGNVVRNASGDPIDYTCTVGRLDSNWCAGRRTVLNDVELGVAVMYNHEWFTGIFPFSPPVFQDNAVSSTFLGSGSSITSSSPITTGTTVKLNTGFDSGTLSGLPDVTWSGASDSDINTPPADNTRNFLGRFGQGEVVSLNVANLPLHTRVCVSFDLFIIGSWDSSGPPVGPDYFRVDIDGGDGIYEHDQNYDQSNNTGASEEDTLGYNTTTSWGDMVFPMTICKDGHTGSDVDIDFSALLSNSDLDNESWGIDNVVITTEL